MNNNGMRRVLRCAIGGMLSAVIVFPASAETTCTTADNVTDAITAESAGATAENPGTVYLRPGTYTTANFLPDSATHMLILDTLVRVIGLGATPAETVIDGEFRRRLVSMNHAGARLENLSFSNASNNLTTTKTAFGLRLDAGTVTNCVFADGVIPALDGTTRNNLEHYVWQTGGLVVDTEFRGLVDKTSTGSRDYTGAIVFQLETNAHWNCVTVRNCQGGNRSIVYGKGSGVLIENSRFLDNYKRAANGWVYGALWLQDHATVRGSVIAGGTTDGPSNNANAGLTLDTSSVADQCVISNNVATYRGGVYVMNAARLSNSLVVNNHAFVDCGGVYIAGNSSQVVNCTITGNVNENETTANGVYLESGIVKNSIIVGNGYDLARNLVCKETTPKVTNCCLTAAISGREAWNVVADPLFVAAAADDWRLQLASPLRDLGETISGVTDVDLVGTARPQGSGVDLGCYEFPLSGSDECGVKITSTARGKIPYTLTAEAVTVGPRAPAKYTWTLSNGGEPVVIETRVPALSQVISDYGHWTVSLTVTFADESTAEASLTPFVRVLSPVVYVSKNGFNTFPYATEATAARNIATAMANVACSAGNPGIVQILPGTYTTAETLETSSSHMILLTDPIRLVGRGATPADVVLDAERTRRGIRIANVDAAIENLTVANTCDQRGTIPIGFGIQLGAGIVTNCVLASGWIPSGTGDNEHYLFQTGGLVTDSVISNLVDDSYNHDRTSGYACKLSLGAVMRRTLVTGNNCGGYGTVLLEGANVVVEDCTITKNLKRPYNAKVAGGVNIKSGTLRGCEVSYNSVRKFNYAACSRPIGGGLLEGGTVENCRFVGNYELDYDSKWGNKGCVGGVYVSSATLRNCLIVSNEVTRGTAGAHVANSPGVIENCTIAANGVREVSTASLSGFGAQVSGLVYTGTIRNSIIAKNSGTDAQVAIGDLNHRRGFTSNCVEGTDPTGDGTTIHGDPRFKKIARGDFRLLSGSPCLGAGLVLADVTTYLDGTRAIRRRVTISAACRAVPLTDSSSSFDKGEM